MDIEGRLDSKTQLGRGLPLLANCPAGSSYLDGELSLREVSLALLGLL